MVADNTKNNLSVRGLGMVLVDDDPLALKLLTRQLAQLGMTSVETFTSGIQALDFVSGQAGSGNVLFLDLNMPDMDGVEFVRHLVARRYSGSLVLVSAEDTRILETAARLARGHRLRVLGHLEKPVQPDVLRDLLAAWQAEVSRSGAKERRAYGPDDVQLAITGRQLVNYYQPKVDMRSGQLQGVECLVRWQHPEDGLIFPDQFIGTAEDHGLIDDLTRAVLGDALSQSRRWRDAGVPLSVAVNVSMDNLRRLDFADFVLAELNRCGVPPSELVFEITESRLANDVLAPLDILTRLRLRQVGLSIDDFGTGHSSLAQLRDLPFGELKIDRSFVRGSRVDNTARTIVGSSLSMARQLRIKTVAEGIEDVSDWEFLRRQGCDFAQGYFIGKPMPADDIPAWRTQWKVRYLDVANVGA